MFQDKRRRWLILGTVLVASLCIDGYRPSGQEGAPISIETSGGIVSGGNIKAAGSICGAAGCLGGAGGLKRSFYLTQSHHQGSTTLSACQTGFHMASLWEMLDVSNLRYAIDVPDAATQDDSGHGPPSGLGGWVRTGWFSNPDQIVGEANCEVWTSSLSTRWGSLVKLQDVWTKALTVDWLGPWTPAVTQCNMPIGVWCVED